ncbi:MAG TPA: ATP-binding protein [Gammaproteobacteria bacterium]|nr:ATP-binding protein [Gammaproteobacteria bacterium]
MFDAWLLGGIIRGLQSIRQMSKGFQKLFRSGEDCEPAWKRTRPIATLMSSDNKKLIDLDDNQKPTPNSIGYRYSWIKMSEPSIESLRQAFLDHESRIILPDNVSNDIHPDKRIRQTKIQSISIKNAAFLADQEIRFSPNLNCVIGGRGSGKSTLIEYLRILLEKDQLKDIDEQTKERINRVRDTLKCDAKIEVCWENADGVKDRIIWEKDRVNVYERELLDPETYFKNIPISFYSQQQLNRLTESVADDDNIRHAQRLLELIDGFSKNDIDELANQERMLKLQIQEASNNLYKAKTLDKEFKRLQQEYQELNRQWQARSEIQVDARKHQQLKSEARYLNNALGEPGKQFSDVVDLVDMIASSHVRFPAEDSPHAPWFHQYDEKVKNAKNDLALTIRKAVEQFTTTIDGFKASDLTWANIENELREADEKFKEACAAKGLTPNDVGRLQEINQACTKKQQEIDKLATEIKALENTFSDPKTLIQQLYQIWIAQFNIRTKAANLANNQAVFNESHRRFIEASVKYQQDYKNFCELWQQFAPIDKRTRLGKNWEDFGQNLYTLFIQRQDAASPWELLYNWLVGEEKAGLGVVSVQEMSQYVNENSEKWVRLRCSRVQDTVDMKLFRADGTLAGSIADGSLSDGQRNTAALALLLAQEGGPLVIDQPEDELDSNFVFRELIPMLRKVKSKRQLIIATHNANLPVNGDADLVYAFEARDGKGEIIANGGLDQKGVTKAVLDIMEGTEEAFRRRREKYHF